MSDKEKHVPNEKPGVPLGILYGRAKYEIMTAIRNVFNKYPLPAYMAEGILDGALQDIRSQSNLSLSGEYDSYIKSIEKYSEKREEELRIDFEKKKRDLIEKFESDETEYPDMDE